MPSAASTPLMYSAARVSLPGGLLLSILTRSERNFRASALALLRSGEVWAADATATINAVEITRNANRIIGSKIRALRLFSARQASLYHKGHGGKKIKGKRQVSRWFSLVSTDKNN